MNCSNKTPISANKPKLLLLRFETQFFNNIFVGALKVGIIKSFYKWYGRGND
jgi:hypothetical protein